MRQRKWRIAMDVPMFVQNFFPTRVPRRFPWIYGRSITWAYNVAEDFPFDAKEQRCTLYGLHTSATFQSFAVTIGDHTRRPDGLILSLTYCTAAGVEPVQTGLFEAGDVRPLTEPMLFMGKLVRFPLWHQKPTFVAV